MGGNISLTRSTHSVLLRTWYGITRLITRALGRISEPITSKMRGARITKTAYLERSTRRTDHRSPLDDLNASGDICTI